MTKNPDGQEDAPASAQAVPAVRVPDQAHDDRHGALPPGPQEEDSLSRLREVVASSAESRLDQDSRTRFDQTGYLRSFPCPLCSKWIINLNHHVVTQHLTEELRWCDASNQPTDKVFRIRVLKDRVVRAARKK